LANAAFTFSWISPPMIFTKLVNEVRKFVPAPIVHKACLYLRYTPRDVLDYVLGETDPLIPPRRKIFIGGPEFRLIGDEFFGHFQRYGEIKPQSRILDIGCGIGRMSRPFVPFLDPIKGRYEGFDIDVGGIRWCRDHYRNHPNFRFQCADIYNKFYNPSGRVKPEEFTFPYEDASFDFAFATSVFTHMTLPSIARYLKETARVLSPEGRALLTVFLWNAESQSLVTQGKSHLPFREHGDLIVVDPNLPEDAIATRQTDWENAMRDSGLEVVGDVLWGSWCGRAKHVSYQDMVIVRMGQKRGYH
jgi:SAM-dependent methyltransferase